MKTKLPEPAPSSPSSPLISEDDIRDYAHHLYAQNGYIPDRDTENWLEAEACLSAAIPKSESHTRIHHLLMKNAGETHRSKVTGS